MVFRSYYAIFTIVFLTKKKKTTNQHQMEAVRKEATVPDAPEEDVPSSVAENEPDDKPTEAGLWNGLEVESDDQGNLFARLIEPTDDALAGVPPTKPAAVAQVWGVPANLASKVKMTGNAMVNVIIFFFPVFTSKNISDPV